MITLAKIIFFLGLALMFGYGSFYFVCSMISTIKDIREKYSPWDAIIVDIVGLLVCCSGAVYSLGRVFGG